MAREITVGDQVTVAYAYLKTLKKEEARQFSGTLTLVSMQGGMAVVSNGNSSGLCRLSCHVSYLHKA